MSHFKTTRYPAVFAGLLALISVTTAAPPEETLYDFDDKPHALEEHLGQGKWLVVTVWASDCAVCNKEIPELVAFHNAHRERDATVLGISVDGPGGKAQARAFIARHQVSFPNLLDDGRAFKAIYRRATGRPWFGGTPMNLVYAPDGKLAAQRIGPLAKAEIEAFLKEARKDGL
jgi:peroxiredoxin